MIFCYFYLKLLSINGFLIQRIIYKFNKLKILFNQVLKNIALFTFRAEGNFRKTASKPSFMFILQDTSYIKLNELGKICF